MHCKGMNIDQAAQEALRGTFDPGCLYYTPGKLQVLKLQEDYKKQEGANYSLKKFNDELLSHGMAPVQIWREMMIHDKNYGMKFFNLQVRYIQLRFPYACKKIQI